MGAEGIEAEGKDGATRLDRDAIKSKENSALMLPRAFKMRNQPSIEETSDYDTKF